MSNRQLLQTVLIGICLVITAPWSHAQDTDSGIITGVAVSPDAKRVSVKFHGQVGKHAAFVMARPFRLVLDFESTNLGQVTRKIAVNTEPIREIRLGQNQSRARVVVDFGSHPVPPFRVGRMQDGVSVFIGKSTAASAGETGREAGMATRPPHQSLARVAGPTPSERRSSEMIVRRADVQGNLVVVELGNSNNPRLRYRLAVDVDFDRLMVRNATASDSEGALRRFDLVESSSPESDSQDSLKAAAGPRKGEDSGHDAKTSKRKFRWGLPSVTTREPSQPGPYRIGPLKLEKFELQARKSDREG